MFRNRIHLQLCSTGRRLGASTCFHIKVNMDADNAWKLEPLNASAILTLSPSPLSPALLYFSHRANFMTTGHSSGTAPRDESVNRNC